MTDKKTLNVLSLGAGVQSTTLALMAAHGEIAPMPDFAIFADTGAEPTPVYEHLRWLSSGNVLPFPIHTASNGNLYDDILAVRDGRASRISNPPFFTMSEGKDGRLMRGCTRDYKINVIKAFARRMYEEKFGKISAGCIQQWIGISSDEADRSTESEVAYVIHRYPFLEKALRPHGGSGMWFSRQDCLNWLQRNGYPRPPKSACTFCPFRSNEEWLWLKENDPAGFAQAIEIDVAIRSGLPGTKADALYVHRDCQPLSEIDLRRPDERKGQMDLFREECSGMCGV